MTTGWNILGGRLVQPAPFCLIGIVNVTPDSFYDGGRYARPEQAVQRGLTLLDEGAHMLDLGAESTRPGAAPLGDSPERIRTVEAARLLPVVAALRTARPQAVLCVDTCHASTARQALELGAGVVNDVSACERDPALLEVLATFRPGYVLMHGGDKGGATGTDSGAPGTVVDRVLRFFERQMTRLVRAGLPETHIVLDPGVGFGKTNSESVELFSSITRLQSLGRPVYMGLSMKSLFGELLGLPLADRGEATRMATTLLAERGVRYHRVHDVAAAATALGLLQWFAPQGAEM